MSAFEKHGYAVNPEDLARRHKFLSETILFPDKTSRDFYASFNRELILSLGILPTQELIDDIFEACTYLPWKPYADADFLKDIQQPIGIISNWDNTLNDKLKSFFDVRFEWILGSQIEGLKKPDIAFYQLMLSKTNFKPGEILYVGDSIKLDIEPATSLGIQTVLVDRIRFYPTTTLKKADTLHDILSLL